MNDWEDAQDRRDREAELNEEVRSLWYDVYYCRIKQGFKLTPEEAHESACSLADLAMRDFQKRFLDDD